MLLHYTYANRSYSFEPKWNDPDGHSVIFREIVYHLKNVHGNIFSNYADHAYQLDLEVDKLYEYIYIFNDEYKALPYNPKHKKQFLQTFENIYKVFEADVCVRSTIESSLIVKLFSDVLDKLQEIVSVYLTDNAYQGKHRYRRINLEKWAETTDERDMSYEFESVLIQMTDLSRLLERLTESQRRRLVKHIFLKYTLQEIAEQEGVSKQSVSESIAAALKKLRTLF